MDSKDFNIIQELLSNGRQTNLDISKRIKLAPSATLNRIKSLEDDGVIQGYKARLDLRRVGIQFVFYSHVKVSNHAVIPSVSRALCDCEEILEVYEIMGQSACFIKVAAENHDDASQIMQKIGNIPHVVDTDSFLVLKELKNETGRVPLSAIKKPDRKPRKVSQ